MPKDITVTSPSLPGLVPAKDALEMARSFADAIEDDGHGQLRLPRKPNSAELKVLQSQFAEAKRVNRPISEAMADKDRASKAIGKLLSGGFASLTNADPKEMVSVYVAFLYDLPILAIEAAVEDFRRNRVKGWDSNYPPTAPMVYGVADQHRFRIYKESGGPMLERVLSVKRFGNAEVSDAERDRVGGLLRELSEGMKADNKIEEDSRRLKDNKNMMANTEAAHRREWAAHGREPPPGALISVTLAKQLGVFDKAPKLSKRK